MSVHEEGRWREAGAVKLDLNKTWRVVHATRSYSIMCQYPFLGAALGPIHGMVLAFLQEA